MTGEHPEPGQIVFFDGFCGLCDRFVTFAFAHDRHHRLRFAPLQGATAAALFGSSAASEASSPETMILWTPHGVYRRSGAALRVMAGFGGLWRAAALLLAVPAFLRDPAYDLIARNRFRLSPRKDSCRLPRPEERAFFLN
jgi:predicted DCC family thiol-disulfide oxidoreductase YuxK